MGADDRFLERVETVIKAMYEAYDQRPAPLLALYASMLRSAVVDFQDDRRAFAVHRRDSYE